MIGSSIGGLVGNLAGGTVEAIGQYRAAKSAKSAERRQRGMLDELRRETVSSYEQLSPQERSQAMLELARARRSADQNYQWAAQRVEADMLNAMASPAYQAQAAYLADMFTQGIPQGLADEYAGRLRTAQAARGLASGGAATRDEAALLTNMAQQQRMQLLPQLRQLALDPLEIKQSSLASYLQARQVSAALGAAEMQQYFQARGGAQSLAQNEIFPLAEFQQGLIQQMPFTGLNPSAIGMIAHGNVAKSVGSSIGGLFGGGGGTGGGLNDAAQYQPQSASYNVTPNYSGFSW